MSILINGMKMPTCCDDCFALDDHGDYPYCLISHDQRGYTFRTDIRTMPSCPLIEVPMHGRLIDADALLESIKEARKKDPEIEDVYIDDYFTVAEWVVSAPTIIERENGI